MGKKTEMIAVRLPDPLVKAIDKVAKERGVNRSVIIREWLETGSIFGAPLNEWLRDQNVQLQENQAS